MASKGSLSLIEMHVEKAVVGLAAVFTIGVAVYYLMGPNEVMYGGQKVGPGELDEVIHTRALSLKQAIDKVQVEKTAVPTYARQLRDQFSAGLFGDNSGLPTRLRVAAALGGPLPELPAGEVEANVALVTPLPPTRPVTRTGISMVQRRQVEIGESKPSEPGPDEGPVERSWVTVAAYFPVAAETREMTNAGYAGYRAKVNIMGTDVQRQVMTASGDWSEWQDVDPGLAMPKLAVPAPAFDERSGDVLNQTEIERVLELAKASQTQLAQPEFFPVTAGDTWTLPPLAGYEDEAVEEEVEPDQPPPPKPPGPEPPKPPAPKPPDGGGPPPGGGLVRPGGGPAAPAGGPTGTRTDPKAEARKQILRLLKDAQRALSAKQLDQADGLARQVLSNPQTSAAQKRQADAIVAAVRKLREESSPKPAPTGQTTTVKETLVTDPHGADKDPAVWFHDDSVEPGKTYRYRMRVKVWNRYVGKRALLRDPSQASHTLLVGEWSLASDPVTVAPKTHFFVKGPRFGEDPSANIEVFTWHAGDWYKETFTAQVGDVIGDVKSVKTPAVGADGKPRTDIDFSTNAIVLDLRFDEPVWCRRGGSKGDFAYAESKSLVVVYLDPADGQVKERVDRLDRLDPLYRRLSSEVTE